MTRVTGVEPEDHLPEVREPAGFRRSDAELHAELIRRLAEASDCAASDVVVSVRDGHVSLTGAVPSTGDRHRIEAHACAVPGVLSVRDGLSCPDRLGVPRDGDPTGAASKMGKPGFER
jgi:osmotically-inducible protein OsmY